MEKKLIKNQRQLGFLILGLGIVIMVIVVTMFWKESSLDKGATDIDINENKNSEIQNSNQEKTEEDIKKEAYEADKLIQVNALSTGDIESGEKIANESLKNTCKENATFTKAVNTKDSALCDQISDKTLKDFCTKKVENEKKRNI